MSEKFWLCATVFMGTYKLHSTKKQIMNKVLILLIDFDNRGICVIKPMNSLVYVP